MIVKIGRASNGIFFSGGVLVSEEIAQDSVPKEHRDNALDAGDCHPRDGV
jgi:hypothetical protein